MDRSLTTLEQFSKNISDYVAIRDNLNLKVRILIVGNFKPMVEAKTSLLFNYEDIEVVGFSHDGREVVEQVKQLKPDVVVVDIMLPISNGMEARKIISKQFPDVTILILSSLEDDASVCGSLLAGVHGSTLKNKATKELVIAIRSVKQASPHFAPEILDNLAKAETSNFDSTSLNKVAPKVRIIESGNCQSGSDATKYIPAKKLAVKTTDSKAKKAKKPKPEKPLFPYGDWAVVLLGVIFLSRINGMGHHLGHAGLFLLMLALLARPIKGWWGQPLKHRRALGVFAFAATLAHAIYATKNVLDGDLLSMFTMSSMHLWGILTGIISLVLMAPAAATSFQSMQRKLGKNWRKIHLLTVPSLTIAVFHTVLIGPHYLANLNLGMIYQVRTYTVIAAGILVLLIRNKILKPTPCRGETGNHKAC